MSLAAIVAGAPFFFTAGEGDGEGLGVSPVSGVAAGLEEGVADSVGVGEGEGLRFFFFGEALGEDSGAGLGEAFFFFFGEGDTTGSTFSAGLGLEVALFFFDEEGVGDFSGVADGAGVGDFSALSFFFGAVELLRYFRGAGVGVGAKIFLILVPSDSSVCARSEPPTSIAIKKRVPAILLTRRMEGKSSTRAGDG